MIDGLPQPAVHDPSDPFDVLGLPPTFNLTRDQIERAYLERSVHVHPDAVGAAGSDADDASALVHASRETLLSSELRANALLARLGGPSKEAVKSLPPAFLAEVMELREAVEEALASPSPGARRAAREEGLRRRAEFESLVASLFRDISALPPQTRPPALCNMRTHLNAWRYIERMIEQVEATPQRTGL
jgi:molecular chaperone HscB